MTSSKFKKSDQHTHDMAHIEGDHVDDDRVVAVPGPDKRKQARIWATHYNTACNFVVSNICKKYCRLVKKTGY